MIPSLATLSGLYGTIYGMIDFENRKLSLIKVLGKSDSYNINLRIIIYILLYKLYRDNILA